MVTEQEIFSKYGKNFKAGELICKEGDEGSTMFILQSGRIKITKKADDVEKTLVTLEPGDFFGEMAVIDHMKRSASATAVEDCRVIELDEKLFEVHMQTNPKIVKKILKSLSSRLRDTNRQIENLLLKDNNRKIANQLLALTQKNGVKTEKGIRLGKMTSKDLAEMIGLDTPTVAQIVQKMVRSHLVIMDGEEILLSSEENLNKFVRYLEMKKEFGEGD